MTYNTCTETSDMPDPFTKAPLTTHKAPVGRRPLRLLVAILGALLTVGLSAGLLVHGGAPLAHADDHQLYTCGMHPNVIQDEPGTCPICGMNLTPMQRNSPQKGSSTERKIKHWVAPMDPSYIRDEPGKSPMGMDLVPVYEDDGTGSSDGAVIIDPVTVQNMGVRIAKATEGEVYRNIRTVGEVQAPEDRLSVVNLRFSGWIERIYVDETGQRVDRGDRLFEIYSPEVVAAQEEYVLALKASGPDSPLARAARRRLELWGVPSSHIRRVAERRDGQLTVTIPSPSSGFVLHKSVVLGARVMAGQDLYRIGDLSQVWIEAEVYEFDAPYVRHGQAAKVELPYELGRARESEISYVYPTLDPRTRTLRVRLVLDNPEGALLPGMFATVRLKAEPRTGVVVPSEAILHTGERHLLFVSKKVGRYEPREVSLGLVGDNGLTEIVSGVRSGEAVVTSGQFLIDSEAQLQEAVQKMLDARLQKRAQPMDGPMEYVCPLHSDLIAGEDPGFCPIDGLPLMARPAQGGVTP